MHASAKLASDVSNGCNRRGHHLTTVLCLPFYIEASLNLRSQLDMYKQPRIQVVCLESCCTCSRCIWISSLSTVMRWLVSPCLLRNASISATWRTSSFISDPLSPELPQEIPQSMQWPAYHTHTHLHRLLSSHPWLVKFGNSKDGFCRLCSLYFMKAATSLKKCFHFGSIFAAGSIS